MAALDTFTGGKSSEATDDLKHALAGLQNIHSPGASELNLPELEKYTVSQNMTPAQMQAFLQQNNALADQSIDQTGTEAQKAALAQLAETASQGEHGDTTMRAQEAQINQDAARELAGQRGAIDQQAQARGVPLGLLQAALSQQNAGQGAQNAHMAALNAQSNNYQTALNALAQQGTLGSSLQGQQNTQGNTVANAANAMQQFNAANQQNAAATNAGFQQQANVQNTQNANQTGAANTGLANQRTQYNAGVPETIFNNEMQKQTGIANAQKASADQAQAQGQQNAGLYSGILGTAGSVIGGIYGGPAGAATGGAIGKKVGTEAGQNDSGETNAAHGGIMGQDEMCMTQGGPVLGRARFPGDSLLNDTVHAKLSPGEAVIPRSTVQQNPQAIHQLLAQGQPQAGHNPEDVASLLAAMKHLRGSR